MTLIVCKLKASSGANLQGFIRVTSDGVIMDDLTGTAIMPVAKTVALVNGQCTLDLAPSAQARVTYRFEVVQQDADGTGTVWDLRAVVPDSIEPINLLDLQPTGLTRDALDSSVLTVSRRILADETFWSRLKSEAINFKGAYDNAKLYRRGDAITYFGSSYVMISDLVISGKNPISSPSDWLMIAAKGEVAANLVGDNAPYSATTWVNDMASPSKNTLRNVIETKLDTLNGTANGLRTISTPGINDYTTTVPNLMWVTDKTNQAKSEVIATLDSRINSSKPFLNNSYQMAWGSTISITGTSVGGVGKDICKQSAVLTGRLIYEVTTTLTMIHDGSGTRRFAFQYNFGGFLSPEFYEDIPAGFYNTITISHMYAPLNVTSSFVCFLMCSSPHTGTINVPAVSMFSKSTPTT